MPRPTAGSTIHLPPTQFMYTLDQIAYLLGMEMDELPDVVRFMDAGIEYDQVPEIFRYEPSMGRVKDDRRMVAVRITPGPTEATPKEWRIAQSEVVRYLLLCGIRTQEETLLRKPTMYTQF